MNLLHKIGTPVVCMIFATLLLCPKGHAQIVDRIVANVNGQIILYSDLQRQMAMLKARMPNLDLSDPVQKSKIEHEVLEQMIEQKLADMEAKRLKITVGDSEVNARIRQLMAMNNLTRQQLKQKLEANGNSLKNLREQIKHGLERQELIDQVLKSRVVITNQQIDAYLKGQQGQQIADADRVRLALIVLPVGNGNGTPAEVQKTGAQLVNELRSGADFKTLAEHYSKGPAAQNGGDIGYMNQAEIAPFIARAIQGLQKGQVSNLVQGPGGYYIVKILDLKANHINIKNPALREHVRKILFEKEMSRKYQQWLKNLESKAFIQISL